MTLSQLSLLSPEEKRVKIAEALGWADVQCNAGTGGLLKGLPWFGLECGGQGDEYEVVPNYLSDLNAMNIAVKTLTPMQAETFAMHLATSFDGWIAEDSSGGECPSIQINWDVVFKVANASAAEHADAFLLAVLP